jgi:arylsulfatase A-like enzyme
VLCLLVAGCGETGQDAAKESRPEATPEVSKTADIAPVTTEQDQVKTKKVEGFGGVIAESYKDSKEWWAPETRPPEDAPNVIIFLLDDVGFAQVGSFGGLIETPNIDRLADNGLRFNNFHTTALCSPSRASLMAGRNPHSIGLGSHALTAMGFPGYNAIMPESAKSVANYLQEHGYVNYALGKWDHTPLYEVSQVGPFDRWPSGEGFQHAYTFMAADVHQFVPVMWNDHTPEPYRKSVHLDQDLADRAIEWITGHKSIKRDLPFMMLWASGSMHSPHHAPDSHIDKYKGKFDVGWDKARETILARQKKLGVVPANTKLTERIDQIPAWDSLSAEEKSLYARQMEVFAAQMEWVDLQIGRVVAELERIGELDNTLIFVTADNGASGEGGLAGTFNETYVLNGLQTPLEANLRAQEDWGRENTYPHYHAGWAMAGNTPFRYFKQNTVAVSKITWWFTGLTGSKPRVKSAANIIIFPTSHQPLWMLPVSRCLRNTTASNNSLWMAFPWHTLLIIQKRQTKKNDSTTRCSATGRSGWTVGRPSHCMPKECRGTLTSCCHLNRMNGSCTTLLKISPRAPISPKSIRKNCRNSSRSLTKKPGSTTSIRCMTI